jgi:hypothetical protein
MSEFPYTTQLQAGLGRINENISIIRLWKEGDTVSSLCEKAENSGEFPKVTGRRLRNIVAEMFAPRFLKPDSTPARNLNRLLNILPQKAIEQVVYLYTARAQEIFHDFVTEVYWRSYEGGRSSIESEEIRNFIENALIEGKMRKHWEESTIKRVSGYLGGCCLDFGLVTRKPPSSYMIKSLYIEKEMALYLAHDLKFAGLSNSAIANHRDWGLWGMSQSDVISQLKSLSIDGHFMVQDGAGITEISWQYEKMEEVFHAVA